MRCASIRFFSVLVLFFWAFTPSWLVADDLSMLSEAYRVVQEGVIRCGEFRYRLEIHSKTQTQEDEKRIRDEFHKRYESLLAGETNPGRRRMLEEAVINNTPEKLHSQLKANSKQVMSCYFALQDVRIGGDRYFEFTPVNNSGNTDRSEDSSDDLTLLQRTYGDGAADAIAHQPMLGLATAGGHQFAGGKEPQTLGRLNGLLLSQFTTAEKDKKGIDSIVSNCKLSKLPGGELWEVQCTVLPLRASIPTQVRLHINPKKGYIVPYIEESIDPSRPRRIWKSDDYVEVSGVWFPSRSSYTQYARNSPTVGTVPEIVRTEQFEFDTSTLRINNAIPPERFKASLPTGTMITDKKGARFSVQTAVEIGLDEIGDLSKKEGLATPQVTDPNKHLNEQPYRERTLTFLGFFVAVIITLIALWRRKKFTMLVLLLTYQVGCGLTDAPISRPIQVAALQITPNPLIIGDVVAGQDQSFEFQVQNNSPNDLRLLIQPSCGCTTGERERIVPGNDTITVCLTMATSGRTGAFQSEVQFTAMNMPSDALVFEQTIPIEAEFRCDWSCSPRRLVLSGSSDYSTYLSVSGPSGEWPLIEILTRQQCVSYEAVSSAPSEVPGHETRVFEIRAIGSDSDEFIDFRRRGSTTPFFSVPVFISDVPSLTH